MHIQPELQHAEMDQAAAAAEPVTIQPAVAAAAAAIAEQPEGGRGSQRLKDLEFEVKYYDLCPEDFENRHLTADSHTAAEKEAHTCWWRKQFAKQDPPQTEEALTAALTYARKHRKPAPPRPRWLVETYQDSRFLFVSKDSTWIPGGTLVAWGAESNLLKAAGHTEPHRRGHMLWQLRATVWRQLQEDLTELKVDDLRVSETPSSKLKPTKLKRKKGGCEDNEDDSDEASADMRERSGGAAAAAPRPPRHPRSAHAVAPIVDQQDDEGIASEEEEEEVAAAAAAAADSAEDVELEKETEIEDDAPLASYKPPDTNQTTQSAKTRGKTNKPAAAAASAAAKPHLRHRKRQRQQTNSKRK